MTLHLHPLQVCHACPQRQRPCAGACPCTVDNRDILAHARAWDCPEERFPARGAGDLLAKATHALGIAKCGGCARRQAALNRLLPITSRSRDPHFQAKNAGAG